VVQKKLTPFVLYALISSNIDQFSNLFHCHNQQKICNNTVTKDPTTPQAWAYLEGGRGVKNNFFDPKWIFFQIYS